MAQRLTPAEYVSRLLITSELFPATLLIAPVEFEATPAARSESQKELTAPIELFSENAKFTPVLAL
jgi:hypothetical protein